jgi:putative transposase
MHELGFEGKRKGIVKKTTDSNHPHAIDENKLKRKFDARKPDQKWVTDLTYIPMLEGWLFLAIVINLFSRKRPKPVRYCLQGQENRWHSSL